MRLFLIMLGVLVSPVAWSHGVHTHESGFAGGLLHPLSGFDHLLATIAMGLWLSLQRVTGLSIPLYFAALLSGVVIAVLSHGLFADVEWMLAACLMMTGLLLFKVLRLPPHWVAGFMTLVFATHFYTHINEMPAHAGAFSYINGFFISTLLLLVAFTLIGNGAGRYLSPVWMRIAGVMVVAAGVSGFGLA